MVTNVPIPDAVARAAVPAGLGTVTSRGKLLQVLGVSFGVAVIIGLALVVVAISLGQWRALK